MPIGGTYSSAAALVAMATSFAVVTAPVLTLTPGAATASWVGSTPTEQDVLAPAGGSVAWSGSTPAVQASLTVTPAAATATWTGSTRRCSATPSSPRPLRPRRGRVDAGGAGQRHHRPGGRDGLVDRTTPAVQVDATRAPAAATVAWTGSTPNPPAGPDAQPRRRDGRVGGLEHPDRRSGPHPHAGRRNGRVDRVDPDGPTGPHAHPGRPPRPRGPGQPPRCRSRRARRPGPSHGRARRRGSPAPASSPSAPAPHGRVGRISTRGSVARPLSRCPPAAHRSHGPGRRHR
jgi:hypothetical protein